jgi:RHS repeat-associated protein
MTRVKFGILLIAGLAGCPLFGQTKSDPNPRLGVQPGGIYSLSEIESISQTNGNLSFRIPLGSLGPDRAGNSRGVSVLYNSKLWEGTIGTVNVGGVDTAVRSVQKTSSGAWRYGVGYDLELSVRDGVDFNSCDPPPGNFYYLYKLRVVFPDGSKHLLRQATKQGELLGRGDDYDGGGYYKFQPDGWNSASGGTSGYCSQIPVQLPNPLVYYSTDGTFVRLEISHNTVAPTQKTSWKLFFPNGDYVLGGNDPVNFQARPQSICDRNNNCVSLDYQFKAGSVAFSDAYFTSLSDGFGRSISIAYGGTNFSGGPDTVTVPGVSGTSLTWTINWTAISGATSPSYTCPPVTGSGSPTCSAVLADYMVDSIVPPTQAQLGSYQFGYNAKWGELSSVTLPSGAKANYTYWLDSNAAASGCSDTVSGYPIWYDILANYPCKKKVYWDGNDTQTTPSETSTFILNRTIGTFYTSYASSTFTDPSGGTTTTKFYPYSYAVGASPGDWQSGLVYEVDQPDGSVISRTWAQNLLYGVSLPYDSQNAYVSIETRTLTGTDTNNQQVTFTAQTTNTVDRNGNPLVTTQKDWDSSIIRKTTLSYYNSTTDATTAPSSNETNWYWNTGAAALLNLASTRMIEGPTTSASLEQYCYDQAASPTAGNLTTLARLASGVAGSSIIACSTDTLAAGAIATKFRYGTGGILKLTQDPRGVSTRNLYDANNLYVSEKDAACNTLLDPSQNCTLPEVRKTQYITDFYSGKVTKVTELDVSTSSGSIETNTTYDVFGRPTSITDPTTATTDISYHDANPRYQLTKSPLDTRKVWSATCFDQLGRVIETQTSEDGTLSPCAADEIRSLTKYAYTSSGRSEWSSNPSRGAGESTMGWTRRKYGSDGRIAETVTFSGDDSAGESASTITGKKSVSYNGPCHTVLDEAANAPTAANPGSKLTTCLDAAGRIASVTETKVLPPNPVTYTTTYAYDAMDNLTDVYQGGQHREFRYDPLGRLMTAKNPENGTTTYGYDKNGNLISKLNGNIYTCFGPVVTTPAACNASADFDSGVNNFYDGLNRPTGKRYSDGTTPSVAYGYSEDLSGGQTNYHKGRLTSIVSGNTTIQFNSFDAAGRVLRHTQTTTGGVGSPYVFGYQYNTGGLLTQLTYPSGRVLTTTYDGAGRPGSVSGQLGSVSTPYAGPPTGKTYIQYAPHGAVSQMFLSQGAGGTWQMNEQHGYNSRLQAISISLATATGTPVTIRNLTFGYGSAENNGNLLSQGMSGAGLTSALSQSYEYDRLNRITKVAEGTTWSRNFDYDQYGNRWVSAYAPSSFAPDPSTPQSQGAVNANTNQTGIAGSSWDGAGNLNNIGTGSFLFYYDAENRMTRSVLGSATVYQYDGEGRRVAKIDCPSNMTTCDAATPGAAVTSFAYDAQGQLAAEYSNHPSSQPCTTCYLLADHLGSTRVMADSTGTAVQCHDYLPFGEELLAGTFGRNGCYSPASGSGLLFTAKERDAETGLDYFGARYYSGAQGRFTGPDLISGWPSRPQSWNRYAYALNNPGRYIDPSGLASVDAEGYWVGDYNGEKDCSTNNKCLYWNAGAGQWQENDPRPPLPWWDLPGEWFVGFGEFALNGNASGLGQMASATAKALPLYGAASALTSTGIEAIALSQTAEMNAFQSVVEKVAAHLARNPELAQQVLSAGEYSFYQTQAGFGRVYGTAIQRLVALEIESSPELASLFEHVGLPFVKGVDFVGKSGSAAAGLRFDITTVLQFATKAVKYGRDVLVPTYVRPPFPF